MPRFRWGGRKNGELPSITATDRLFAAPADDAYERAADLLAAAYDARVWCAPVRTLIGETPQAGYRVQALNTARWIGQGRRVAGRKIGLTSPAVQRQFGVYEPDYGVLFADMAFGQYDSLPALQVQQPRVEAEIALALERDLTSERPTHADILAATAYVAPAIEIVCSRIADWDISIADTIADNASSGLFVIGAPSLHFRTLDFAACAMEMTRAGAIVSSGTGAACLGHPLNAAAWLARKQVELGAPLRAGEVVLTGALGPMVAARADDRFEACISGIGRVRTHFAP